MYMVRAPDAADAAAPVGPMRVPQAPQKANPAVTIRPQFGHGVPAAPVVSCGCAEPETVSGVAGADDELVVRGAGGQPPPPATPDEDDETTGGGVDAPMVPEATAPPLCWGLTGIFGESFHGIPPLGFGVVSTGSGVGSLPKLPVCATLSGGRMVRAVSSGPGSLAAGLAAAFISLPQPRQNL
jgi:hypothetical protein